MTESCGFWMMVAGVPGAVLGLGLLVSLVAPIRRPPALTWT